MPLAVKEMMKTTRYVSTHRICFSPGDLAVLYQNSSINSTTLHEFQPCDFCALRLGPVRMEAANCLVIVRLKWVFKQNVRDCSPALPQDTDNPHCAQPRVLWKEQNFGGIQHGTPGSSGQGRLSLPVPLELPPHRNWAKLQSTS